MAQIGVHHDRGPSFKQQRHQLPAAAVAIWRATLATVCELDHFPPANALFGWLHTFWTENTQLNELKEGNPAKNKIKDEPRQVLAGTRVDEGCD